VPVAALTLQKGKKKRPVYPRNHRLGRRRFVLPCRPEEEGNTLTTKKGFPGNLRGKKARPSITLASPIIFPFPEKEAWSRREGKGSAIGASCREGGGGLPSARGCLELFASSRFCHRPLPKKDVIHSRKKEHRPDVRQHRAAGGGNMRVYEHIAYDPSRKGESCKILGGGGEGDKPLFILLAMGGSKKSTHSTGEKAPTLLHLIEGTISFTPEWLKIRSLWERGTDVCFLNGRERNLLRTARANHLDPSWRGGELKGIPVREKSFRAGEGLSFPPSHGKREGI